jgi:membrane protease YdiL (CAAX protease family)
METSQNSLLNMTPPMRLALFLGATGICMILGALISFSLVAAMLHIGINDIQKIILEPEYASTAQFANALASIIAFGLPSIAVAFFTKGNLAQNMGFAPLKSIHQWVLVLLLALAGLVLSGALGSLTEKIPIPISFKNWADGLEAQYKKALVSMTQMRSIVDLMYALLAVAIVPAIVEELYFRGALQKTLKDWTGKPIVAIIVTALFFSAIHFSYYGFLSRMALGILLGLIYEFTKTIWLPILLHFINNGIAIVTLYAVRNNPAHVEKAMDENLPIYWGVLALVTIYILLIKLQKINDHAGLEKSV